MSTPIGPNAKKLLSYRMAQLAIPDGTPHPIAAGARAILDPGRFAQLSREAADWVQAAIAVVKTAPDNPYGEDDEAIAGELVRRLEDRIAQQRKE